MKSRLSAFDAFFVAYQECSGVLMQLGVEVELRGPLKSDDLEQMLRQVVRRWPTLGQRLEPGLFGLSWTGECRIDEMFQVAEEREALGEWRNRPLDPFKEPPFQLLWIRDRGMNLLAFRAHHAVVDGEGFFGVCVEAVRALADVCNERLFGVRRLVAALVCNSESSTKAATSRRTPKRRLGIRQAFEEVRRLRQEAKANRSAQLAMRSCVPGEASIVERDLDQFRELKRRASELHVAPGWLCASAWMKAIHAWNVLQRVDSPTTISLEVPVSLRRKRDQGLCIGNHISPLTLYGDATLPLEDLAISLKQQMSNAVRRSLHLALPTLALPAKFLPWPLFRNLVANPELTGFATSHFAWFEQSRTIHEDILRLSGGALEIVDQQIYTPVCLHMGAAMSILAWPERAQIFLTHRLSAFSVSDAGLLLDLTVQELGRNSLALRQVAV